MHQYPVEHAVSKHIKKLLSNEQRKYLYNGAHFLIVDNGEFYKQCRQQFRERKIDCINNPAFIIYGMSRGDILIELSQSDEKSATLLSIKPHLPPQPHFIKSFIMALIENFFGISFGPKGFCRYTKERPIVVTPHPILPQKNTHRDILLSQSSFLPTYNSDSKRKLKMDTITDHVEVKQLVNNKSKSNIT